MRTAPATRIAFRPSGLRSSVASRSSRLGVAEAALFVLGLLGASEVICREITEMFQGLSRTVGVSSRAARGPRVDSIAQPSRTTVVWVVRDQ
jgi:hypothetical protein